MSRSEHLRRASAIALTVVVVGCGDDRIIVNVPVPVAPKASFDVASGDPDAVPFPNDLGFEGSSDGTLNYLVADPNDITNPAVAINTLDGFSTMGRILIPFDAPLDADDRSAFSVAAASAVRFFELDPVPATNFHRLLQPFVDYDIRMSSADPRVLELVPMRPLLPGTRYGIALRSLPGIPAFRAADGTAAEADADFAAILDARAGRIATPPHLIFARAQVDTVLDVVTGPNAPGAFPFPEAEIIVAFRFTTQSADAVLGAALGTVAPRPIAIDAMVGTNKSLLDPGAVDAGLRDVADVYAGHLEIAYFLDRADPSQGRWLNAAGEVPGPLDPVPVATELLNAPFLLLVPNGGAAGGSVTARPAGGWPVAVFLHSFDGDRAAVLELAQAFADRGVALIAIDLPLHGLPPGHALRVPSVMVSISELTFDIDLSENATGAPGADGIADPSGRHFIVHGSLLTTRDNFRQGVLNLAQLVASLPALDYDGAAGGDFGAGGVRVIGHGLGATVASTYLAIDPVDRAATLAMPAGAVFESLLRDSPTLAPRATAALARMGIVPGTLGYERFVQVAQAVADAVDPVNRAPALTDRALHVIRLAAPFGGEPDSVVPIASTVRLTSEIQGLTCTNQDSTFAPSRALTRFLSGSHAALVARAGSNAVTDEMQHQAAVHAASGELDVLDSNLMVLPQGGDLHGLDCN